MKIVLMILVLFNTSCINSQKKPSKSSNNKFICEIDLNKVTNFSYLKDRLDDFNSEDSDCIEAFFSFRTNIFDKKNVAIQKDYLEAIKFLYDNSNSLSSTLIESSVFNYVFYDNLNVFSNYLFNNRNSSLSKALKMGISYEYSNFEGKERDEKYKALYKKVSSEIRNESHKNYIIKILSNIDRGLYD